MIYTTEYGRNIEVEVTPGGSLWLTTESYDTVLTKQEAFMLAGALCEQAMALDD